MVDGEWRDEAEIGVGIEADIEKDIETRRDSSLRGLRSVPQNNIRDARPANDAEQAPSGK